MTNRPRKVGTAAETAVVNWFRHPAQGQPQVERKSLHGTKDEGDLTGIPGLVLSVKFVGQGKRMDLSGWLRDVEVMRANVGERAPSLPLPDGLLIVRRAGYPDPGDWYAVQTLSSWWSIYADRK